MAKQSWAVILAGGQGTRFWPLSTPNRPKQLLALCTDHSMLLETILRVGGSVAPLTRTVVVTGPELADKVREVVKAIGVQVLVEPEARSTGPCLAWVAGWIQARDPGAVMCVFPSDHYVEDTTAFRALACRAHELASTEQRIVTLGIKPDRPATGFGYIRVAERAYGDAYVAGGFVEKPGVELAQQYLESGEYLWNAGMFFMGTDVLLQAVQRHRPAWSEAVAAGVADTTGEALRQFFSQVESVSIDVAIMEPEGEALLVIPADCGWCDLGSWSALLDFANQGTSYAKGPTRLVDVEDSVIVSEGPRVTVMGLTNVCVVATGDEVLVLDLASDQAVRALALSDKDKSE